MSSSEQDGPLQRAQDTEGKGWQETVPEVLTLIVTHFASTHHMSSACCGSELCAIVNQWRMLMRTLCSVAVLVDWVKVLLSANFFGCWQRVERELTMQSHHQRVDLVLTFAD